MTNVVNAFLATALNAGADTLQADSAGILAWAATEGVTLETAVDSFVDSAIDAAAGKNVLLGALKGSIKTAAHAAIGQLVSLAGSQEAAMLALIEATARNEAKKLAA